MLKHSSPQCENVQILNPKWQIQKQANSPRNYSSGEKPATGLRMTTTTKTIDSLRGSYRIAAFTLGLTSHQSMFVPDLDKTHIFNAKDADSHIHSLIAHILTEPHTWSSGKKHKNFALARLYLVFPGRSCLIPPRVQRLLLRDQIFTNTFSNTNESSTCTITI